MQINKLSAAIVLSFLLTGTAFALPVISSGEDQNFYQNYGATQFFDLKITEDANTGYIKAGTIKITIPGTLDAIFDSKRTNEEITLYGSAVTSGHMEAKPKITFEDGDRTLVLPVKQDFAPGEFVVVTRFFAEGFHSQPANSVNLKLTVGNGETVFDSFSKFIQSSANQDTTNPDKPTDLAVADLSLGLMLTWKDPTDLDLKTIQIFRSKNNGALIMVKEVAKGVQEYNDTDITNGDTLKYQLKAFDGLNYSDLSTEVIYVAGSHAGETQQTQDTQTQQTQTTQNTQTQTTQTQETETKAPACDNPFSDVDFANPNCAAIQYLKDNNIIGGYADGTFKPNAEINRAEFLKVVILMFKKSLQSGSTLNFTDTDKNAWYATYVATAKTLGVIEGYPDGTFKPAQGVNKVEAMKMILQTSAKTLPADITVAPFNDTPLNSWYIPFVEFFKTGSIDLGDSNGNLTPAKKMTRGEIAEYLYKFARL